MKFIDEAKITLRAGDGGRGCVSFRREKYVPHGGPNGGDGGDGGSVVFVAEPGMSTLLDFQYRRIFAAERGEHGMGKQMYGRRGKDLLIRVPVGTVVREAGTGEVLADLTRAKEKWVAVHGGRGGKGNLHFASSRNRAPRTAQPGGKGEELEVRLELKLLADVGLVGRPNAGKSTLISRISAARPKIADYPFTTLTPVLGVVQAGPYKNFTVADIPGLIEGAHQGVGMGIRFLKHIERTGVFLHLIDLSDPESPDPVKSYQKIDAELNAYSPAFKKKKRWVVFSKIDLLQDKKVLKKAMAAFAKKKLKTFAISAVTGAGVKELVAALGKKIGSKGL